MKISSFIAELAERRVIVRELDNQLEVNIPNGEDVSDLLVKLKTYKKEVIQYIRQSKRQTHLENISFIEDQEYYGVSKAQHRLWTICQVPETNLAYNMISSYEINDSINIDNLQASIRQLGEKYEILRSNIIDLAGVPKQVYKVLSLDLEVINLSASNDSHLIVQKALDEELDKSIDLSKDPLCKITLFSLARDKYVLLLKIHHIISDAVSNKLIVKTIIDNYLKLIDDNKNDHTQRIQFKDYAAWENRKFREGELQRHKSYWLNQLKGNLPVLEFPAFRTRPKVKTYGGHSFNYSLGREAASQMSEICKQYQCSLYMASLTLLGVLLHRCTSQDDFIFGSPISSRIHPALDDQVGFFVNTAPIRIRVFSDESFEQLIAKVKSIILDADSHKEYPFDQLIQDLQINKDLSRSPLFDIMISAEVIEEDKGAKESKQIKIRPYKVSTTTSKYDLIMVFRYVKDDLEVQVSYNSDILEKSECIKFCGHYKRLIREVSNNKRLPIKDLNYLSDSEFDKLVNKNNATASKYPKEQNIVSLFEEQVKKGPNGIAIVSSHLQLTYLELNKYADQFADRLLNLGAENSLIAVNMAPTEKVFVAILGILKVGAGYIPLDFQSPTQRLNYILKDANTQLLIYDGENAEKSKTLEVQEKLMFELEPGYAKASNTKANNVDITPNRPAYAMYTSGSTGQPKGVIVSHKSVISLVKGTNYLKVGPGDHFIQLSNLSFDGSIFDIFATLLNGATMHVTNEKTIFSIQHLSYYLLSRHINIGFMTTVLFNSLVELDPKAISGFDKLYFGGENASNSFVKEACNYQKKVGSITHVYGPTEATTFSTYHPVLSNDYNGKLPIGKPISNTQIYVLDENLNVVPEGIVGEIFIGGVGLALGYLNKPELTAEMFIMNPFIKGTIIYKTGDLGIWNSNGRILFVGRKDHQVKVNGFRIELGEIEHFLLMHPLINQAVVLVDYEGQSKQILAYYTGSNLESEMVRKYLNDLIPGYMMPHQFVWVDRFPLTKNGKIDRVKLLTIQSKQESKILVKPRNKKEELLCAIWEKVLGRKPVSIDDNFFQLGGDSIRAIQISARIKEKGFKFEVKDIYTNPTITESALCLKPLKKRKEEKPVFGEVLLSPIQSDFFSWNLEEPHHFNQSYMLFSADGYEPEEIKKCFQKIIDHHDVLRSNFVLKENRWHQYIQESTEIKVDFFDVRDLKDDKMEIIKTAQMLQSQLQLDIAPLIKLGVFQAKTGTYLLIVMHHLIVDTVSWRIIIEDLTNLLDSTATNNKLVLPDKTTSFQLWMKTLYQYSEDHDKIKKEKKYWFNLDLNGIKRINPGFQRIVGNNSALKAKHIRLSQYHTELLLTKANTPFNTKINDILITSLGLAIHKTFGIKKILIAMEGHGRESIEENIDLSRTVGWFTSVFPFLLEIYPQAGLEKQLISVKEKRTKMPNMGIGFGILKQDTKYRNEKILKYKPQVSFNYLGQFDQELVENTINVDNNLAGSPISIKNTRWHELEITGKVINHTLSLGLIFDSNQFNKDTMSSFMDNYQKSLIELIEFCAYQKERVLTPSDFKIDELTQETLDKLNSLFD